jgi:hypothetical protein
VSRNYICPGQIHGCPGILTWVSTIFPNALKSRRISGCTEISAISTVSTVGVQKHPASRNAWPAKFMGVRKYPQTP